MELQTENQADRGEPGPRRQLELALRRILNRVSGAAFFVSRSSVSGANAEGTAALEREGDELRRRLCELVGAVRAALGYDVIATGIPGEFIVLRCEISPNVASRFDRATARWDLSPRQVDVLRGLVDGQSNVTIAERLGCNARTVEAHVAALLGRADARSRLELVASFWWDL